jgi:uncharacterized protein YbcV (DUF1398 family)
MSTAIDNLKAAQGRAMAIRPKVDGFPVLAEVLRRAGVHRNVWSLPSAQSLYVTDHGIVIDQAAPLVSGLVDVAALDQAAVVAAIRADQDGQSSFAEFLAGLWRAGVIQYVCDFDARTVTYSGAGGESYVEAYRATDQHGTNQHAPLPRSPSLV